MYAIIKTGGKQYRVEKDQTVDVEKLMGETGSEVTFDNVLLFVSDKEVKIGKPKVEGCQVKGELIGEVKGNKVDSIKYKRRKNQYRHWGHRQRYSRVKITEISG